MKLLPLIDVSNKFDIPTISYKIFETNSSFHLKSALRQKSNFYFSRAFR